MVKIIVSAVAALSAGVASAFGTITEFPTEMTSLMDQTVDPCTDFFSYSCGTWYNKTTLHSNEARINVHSVLAAAADKVIEKHLGLGSHRSPRQGNPQRQLDRRSHFRGATISKATGVPLFVKLSVSATTRNILSAVHPGLPFGQEYFHEPLWATVEKSYRQYLATIFTLAGHAEVETAIDVVIKFERMNAGVEPSKRRLQEAVTPRRLSLSDANASYPLGLGLPLQGFGFDVHKGCNTTTVLVNDPYYFDFLEKMLRRMHVDDLKTIIEYKVLDFNAVNTVCKSTFGLL
ncbi:hypothetical protein H257_17100 [Aphanomyces astaci]|uniref:Peptidase M13 N-terminal domain-containing protein n=1 Tax=Aphanomyces astaci TaxID=112090 RepID=W4FFY9_APHAT|nr:hypothetical protein H257_17100 [Aphanomyces astaci]ETV66432.1 hypothetical protein H257_17100 [Aphanomyces astaci]|eukprot:XP_009844066.1 hypothetical protein H257_17100 [Aphanomyces astaci]